MHADELRPDALRVTPEIHVPGAACRPRELPRSSHQLRFKWSLRHQQSNPCLSCQWPNDEGRITTRHVVLCL